MKDAAPSPTPREQEVFFAALEITDREARAAYLDRACADDPLLRRWVERELRKQTAGLSHLSRTEEATPSGEPGGGSSLSPEMEALLARLKPEEPGDRIGPYQLLEMLGEGGFGTVWLAQQEKPVRREVALKLLKVGMDSRQVIGRFEQERQALALLDHPGIAKVFDAGATETGRPFFVMELVRGKPITEFADEKRLTIRHRIELCLRVCHAVQHAHQKGIIHRDLKPSNILVIREDGVLVVKVIDLGLAKATAPMGSERTLVVTQAERMLGTPLYMSPEQADGSADIDTRTDIYALGVILYELLTGRTPHDPNEMARRSHDEIRRAIREQDPPPPSAALRRLREGALRATAQLSGTDTAQLLRTVRGDLDAICMKALEKDRRRRYSSAASLAADLQAYLLNEPVSARIPSQWYRARKFAIRNQRAVSAGASILAVIVMGAVISVREAMLAHTAEMAALTARSQEAEQRQVAERERTRAENEGEAARLSEFVADIGLAQQSLNSGNLGRALQLLARHVPTQESGAEERGWSSRYLWKLAQGDEHTDLPSHPGRVRTVAFSPGGDLLVVAGHEETTVCDLRTRALVATLPVAADSVAFLPDGASLALSVGGQVRTWKVADWTEEKSPPQLSPGGFVATPDGKHVAIIDSAGVQILEAGSLQCVRSFAGARPPLSFSPDGTVLASDTASGLTLWPMDCGAPRLLEDSAGILIPIGENYLRLSQGIVFTSGGSQVVAVQNRASERGVFVLRIWDAHSGRDLGTLPGDPERIEHAGAITALAVSPDGRTLATTSLDHSIRLWDITTRHRLAMLQGHHAEVGAAAFSPDGRTLATGDRLGEVKIWSVQREGKEDALTDVTRPLGFSHDGKTMAVLTPGSVVRFYDPVTKAQQRELVLEATPTPSHVAMSADLGTLAQTQADGTVKIWNTGSGESRVVRDFAGPLEMLALTNDGSLLFTAGAGRPVRIDDLRSGEHRELPFGAGRIIPSPDGHTLAVFRRRRPAAMAALNEPPGLPPPAPPVGLAEAPAAGAVAESVFLWDLETSAYRAHFDSKIGEPLDASFSPDGSLFATVGPDNAIRLWGTATGVALGTFTGHKQIVRSVAFAYDRSTLASTSDDSTLRLWNIATQQELLSFQELGSDMRDLLFSPDNETLVVRRTTQTQRHDLLFRRAPRTIDAITSTSQPQAEKAR